jgi:hypothetical protein
LAQAAVGWRNIRSASQRWQFFRGLAGLGVAKSRAPTRKVIEMGQIMTNIEVAGGTYSAGIRYEEFVEEFHKALVEQRFMEVRGFNGGKLTINPLVIQAIQDYSID